MVEHNLSLLRCSPPTIFRVYWKVRLDDELVILLIDRQEITTQNKSRRFLILNKGVYISVGKNKEDVMRWTMGTSTFPAGTQGWAVSKHSS